MTVFLILVSAISLLMVLYVPIRSIIIDQPLIRDIPIALSLVFAGGNILLRPKSFGRLNYLDLSVAIYLLTGFSLLVLRYFGGEPLGTNLFAMRNIFFPVSCYLAAKLAFNKFSNISIYIKVLLLCVAILLCDVFIEVALLKLMGAPKSVLPWFSWWISRVTEGFTPDQMYLINDNFLFGRIPTFFGYPHPTAIMLTAMGMMYASTIEERRIYYFFGLLWTIFIATVLLYVKMSILVMGVSITMLIVLQKRYSGNLVSLVIQTGFALIIYWLFSTHLYERVYNTIYTLYFERSFYQAFIDITMIIDIFGDQKFTELLIGSQTAIDIMAKYGYANEIGFINSLFNYGVIWFLAWLNMIWAALVLSGKNMLHTDRNSPEYKISCGCFIVVCCYVIDSAHYFLLYSPANLEFFSITLGMLSAVAGPQRLPRTVEKP